MINEKATIGTIVVLRTFTSFETFGIIEGFTKHGDAIVNVVGEYKEHISRIGDVDSVGTSWKIASPSAVARACEQFADPMAHREDEEALAEEMRGRSLASMNID